MKKKKEERRKIKEVRRPVMRVGPRKWLNRCLWGLLGVSLAFAVYKNFTAIDTHTVHEKEIIEQRVVDTNRIEVFVKNFAEEFYSWETSKESITARTETVKKYLTEELQHLNIDTVRADIPTSSNVENVQIWSVEPAIENEYAVVYSVDQIIKEGEKITEITSPYKVVVHMDETGNMVIVKNPTICKLPEKSDYQPKVKETDGTADIVTVESATEFLQSFFQLYPNMSEKELAYYVKNNALEPVTGQLVFAELVNPVFTKDEEQIKVSLSVKYLDQQTKAQQISQFDLILQKDDNWLIVGQEN